MVRSLYSAASGMMAQQTNVKKRLKIVYPEAFLY